MPPGDFRFGEDGLPMEVVLTVRLVAPSMKVLGEFSDNLMTTVRSEASKYEMPLRGLDIQTEKVDPW